MFHFVPRFPNRTRSIPSLIERDSVPRNFYDRNISVIVNKFNGTSSRMSFFRLGARAAIVTRSALISSGGNLKTFFKGLPGLNNYHKHKV